MPVRIRKSVSKHFRRPVDRQMAADVVDSSYDVLPPRKAWVLNRDGPSSNEFDRNDVEPATCIFVISVAFEAFYIPEIPWACL